MIYVDINILDHIQLSEQEIDQITLAAKEEAEIKLTELTDDEFDIRSCNLQFELICRVKIENKIV